MTITKTFNFSSDAQGWIPSSAEGTQDQPQMSWRAAQRRRGGSRTYSDIATHGGCLRTTVMGSSGTTNNYWDFTSTWAALGVPSWAVVTSVKADYQYRWDRNNRDPVTIATSTNATGPFQLLTTDYTLIGTTSAAVVLADGSGFAGGSQHEDHYPAHVGNPRGHQTAGVNRFWGQVAGSTVIVPASLSRPSSAVKFRLKHAIQQITWSGQRNFLRLRQDWINITVTYRRRRIATS